MENISKIPVSISVILIILQNIAIHCNKYDRNIPGIYSRFDIKIQNWQTSSLILIQHPPLYVFIDCQMKNISNIFKMLHNLLESLIIKWNLFILSSREQNFNQHLGISFSKETFLPRRWLWIYYIGDVWRVPSCLEVCCGLSQDEREGCWLLRTRPATLTVAP